MPVPIAAIRPKNFGKAPSTLLSGLNAYWKMDEVSDGSVAVARMDSSPNGLHLTDHIGGGGLYTKSANGKQNLSANVSPLGWDHTYLSHAHDPLLNPSGDIMIASWIFPTVQPSEGNSGLVISKDANGDEEYFLGVATSSGILRAVGFIRTSTNYWYSVDTNVALSLNQWYLLRMWYDSATKIVYLKVNDATSTTMVTTGTRTIGTAEFQIGQRAYVGSPLGFSGRVDDTGIWNRLWTDTEYSAYWNGGNGVTHPFDHSAGMHQDSRTNLVFEGNSLTVGVGGTPYPNQLIALYANPSNFVWNNIALNGDTAANIVGEYNQAFVYYDPAYARNIFVLWAGTNDLGTNGDSAANVWGYIKTICAKQKAEGFKTIVLTIIPRSDASWDASKEIQRDLLNASIMGGDVSIDQVADVASLPNLQDPNNTTYFADKLHLTTAGYADVATLVKSKIDLI